MFRWLFNRYETRIIRETSKPSFVRLLVTQDSKAKRGDYWTICINFEQIISFHAQAGIQAGEDESGSTILLIDKTVYYTTEHLNDLILRLGFEDNEDNDDDDEDDDDNEDEDDNTDDDPPTLTKEQFETSFNGN